MTAENDSVKASFHNLENWLCKTDLMENVWPPSFEWSKCLKNRGRIEASLVIKKLSMKAFPVWRDSFSAFFNGFSFIVFDSRIHGIVASTSDLNCHTNSWSPHVSVVLVDESWFLSYKLHSASFPVTLLLITQNLWDVLSYHLSLSQYYEHILSWTIFLITKNYL